MEKVDPSQYTCTKSKIDLYKLRHPQGMYWADISLDIGPERGGRISISSDFGNWAYYWGSPGSSFKEFLCKIHIDYTASKFGAGHWFDFEATIKRFKTSILESRRVEAIDAEYARQMFDEILYVNENCSEHEGEFTNMMMSDAENFMKWQDYMPSLAYDVTPQFRAFWDTAWPAFKFILEKEIAEENVVEDVK